MIEATNLVKKFGSQTAVDGVSFSIPQGQLVGFLGPNGAGKTTTMRLLTGYLPLDGGKAKLLGHDLVENSIEIRRRLGYLPENNPLPDDLEVTDYLHFVGRMRGLHDLSARWVQVKRVIKLCSLKSVVGKRLAELSKGFRQRVGLAQAIIHDPDILILDEPTSGLDPNQVQEVRGLILELKKQKTMLISTHILPEVRQTCDRLLIINKGKIVADGAPSTIAGSQQNGIRLFVAFHGPIENVESELKNLSGAISVSRHTSAQGDHGFVIESAQDCDLRVPVFQLAARHNWPLLAMNQEQRSLEEIFRLLTTDAISNEKGASYASMG